MPGQCMRTSVHTAPHRTHLSRLSSINAASGLCGATAAVCLRSCRCGKLTGGPTGSPSIVSRVASAAAAPAGDASSATSMAAVAGEVASVTTGGAVGDGVATNATAENERGMGSPLDGGAAPVPLDARGLAAVGSASGASDADGTEPARGRPSGDMAAEAGDGGAGRGRRGPGGGGSGAARVDAELTERARIWMGAAGAAGAAADGPAVGRVDAEADAESVEVGVGGRERGRDTGAAMVATDERDDAPPPVTAAIARPSFPAARRTSADADPPWLDGAARGWGGCTFPVLTEVTPVAGAADGAEALAIAGVAADAAEVALARLATEATSSASSTSKVAAAAGATPVAEVPNASASGGSVMSLGAAAAAATTSGGGSAVGSAGRASPVAAGAENDRREGTLGVPPGRTYGDDDGVRPCDGGRIGVVPVGTVVWPRQRGNKERRETGREETRKRESGANGR